MKTILLTTLLFLSTLLDIKSQNHRLFTEILSDHVKNGLVDYENLRNDDRFPKYLDHLSSTNPEELSRKDILAFWINAYNAFTLQIITENYPVESITDLHTGGRIIGYLLGKTVWDKEFITIYNKNYSLNEIEHDILRRMHEPRIHFAIVCASISCPELRSEAFEASEIESQLEEQTIKFINDPARNYFDLKNREAEISEIFNWFEEDFGNSEKEVLLFISNYLPDKIASDINKNLSQWEVSYLDYDWGLNEYEAK